MVFENYKISFCIVCMNRLHQLKETLLKNILDNYDYSNLEFLVLNYNSQDGMDEWIKDCLGNYLSAGKVVYYHTTEPASFSHSHSKNLAFKLATGDIVCNLNADHYTGKGFAAYVNKKFTEEKRIVLTTVDYFNTKLDYHPAKDVFGKVCVKKSDFLKVRGFDEQMDHYGFEDWDFVNRLEMDGCKRTFVEDFAYLNYISHGEDERFNLPTDDIYGLYVNYQTPSTSEILFLYKNYSFEKGTLIDNWTINSDNYICAYYRQGSRFEYSVENRKWIRGEWDIVHDDIHLTDKISGTRTFKSSPNTLVEHGSNATYYQIADPEIMENLMTFHYFYHNRVLMEKNLEEKIIVVNKTGFGEVTLIDTNQGE